jgi:hypothetical protein
MGHYSHSQSEALHERQPFVTGGCPGGRRHFSNSSKRVSKDEIAMPWLLSVWTAM